MSRRPHFSHEPSPERASPLTPEALTKQQFGRRLQQLLSERGWRQSDLVREIEKTSDRPLGRESISSYVSGKQFPTPSSIDQLCTAFGVKREELLPNSVINATNDEHPSFELRAAHGVPGQAWVRVNRLMSFETAAEIARLLNLEDKRAAGE